MIAITRRVVRKVTSHTGELLVVSLTPEGIYLNEYRRRRTSARLLPYSAALLRATQMSVDAMRSEKARPRRKVKRSALGKAK